MIKCVAVSPSRMRGHITGIATSDDTVDGRGTRGDGPVAVLLNIYLIIYIYNILF
jgi:hypothetical protein